MMGLKWVSGQGMDASWGMGDGGCGATEIKEPEKSL